MVILDRHTKVLSIMNVNSVFRVNRKYTWQPVGTVVYAEKMLVTNQGVKILTKKGFVYDPADLD